MRLILVRHGETLWNSERRIQGCRSNTELSTRGKQQVEKIALSLKNHKVASIFSSPLKRAMDTACVIAQAYGLEVRAMPGLKEIDAGELEGLTEKQLKGRYSEFWEEWKRGNPSLRLPGGESLDELQRRAWRVIEQIIENYPDEVVVVVGHFFINLTIICQALEIDLRHIRRMRQDLAAISILELTRQRNSLLLLNDNCHLLV
jgi:probable phosphoglycerate mutase